MSLSSENIKFIDNYLKNSEVIYYDIRMEMLDHVASAVEQKDVTSGDANGHAEIVLDPADTDNVTPGKYFYDIKVEEASGAIYKLDEGKITIDGSPTNRMA